MVFAWQSSVKYISLTLNSENNASAFGNKTARRIRDQINDILLWRSV